MAFGSIPKLSNQLRIHDVPSPSTSKRRPPLSTSSSKSGAATCSHSPSGVASASAYRSPATSTTAVYVQISLRPVDGWALVLTSSGSTITTPSSTTRGCGGGTGGGGGPGVGSPPGHPVRAHAG